MMGDFNEIRSNEEKSGGPRRGEETFVPFNNMLDICEMEVLQSSGNSLTWGGQRGTHWVQ